VKILDLVPIEQRQPALGTRAICHNRSPHTASATTVVTAAMT
jgi:hypothetical protein